MKNDYAEKRQKYLVNCQFGSDDPERATISLILAVSAAKSAEAVIFATSGASELCIKGGAERIQASGYESAASLLEDFVNHGGRIWLCPVCARARQITDADLITGVEIAGAPRSMEFLATGGQVLA